MVSLVRIMNVKGMKSGLYIPLSHKFKNASISKNFETNALSVCPDKIFFVLDKIRFVLDKIILSRTKYFLSKTKILSMAQKSFFLCWNSFQAMEKNILSWTKLLCLGQIWFCPRQKIFCLGRWTGRYTSNHSVCLCNLKEIFCSS